MAVRRSRGTIRATPSRRLSEAVRISAGTPWYSQSTLEAGRIFARASRRSRFVVSNARWRRSGRLGLASG